MRTVCTVGHRQGLKCDHKRNAGNGFVTCAIDATEKICIFSGGKE